MQHFENSDSVLNYSRDFVVLIHNKRTERLLYLRGDTRERNFLKTVGSM